MNPVRVQDAAAMRIDEIYRYTLRHWSQAQADIYVRGLFEAFAGISTHDISSRPVPAEFEVEGYYFRYGKHFVYWRWLSDGAVGIVTVLHERMHQIKRFKEDFESSE